VIDFSKSVLARGRQDSVTVGGREFRIRTEFFHWVGFERMRRTAESPEEFDRFYAGAVPEDRAEGLKQLDLFHADEQPLPHPEHCERSDVAAWDWLADSEYIAARFLEVYGIDLEREEEMHWHRFLGLFRALLTDAVAIVSARLHRSEDERGPEDGYDRHMERQRDAWWISGTKPAKRARRRRG